MKKTSASFAGIVAAVAFAGAGLALAQTIPQEMPKTSTPGAGCTATGNALSAGNMGGTPTGKCAETPATTAVVPAAPATVATPAPAARPAPTTTESTASTAPAPSSNMATAPAPSEPARTPMRVARADRG